MRGIALVWLTLRQAVPMCLPGLVIACLVALLQTGSVSNFGYVDDLPSAMWIIGLLWGVVVGSGIFATEIDARIGEFWRTLPISPWRLFATKFVIGLLVVLLVLDGSVIAATWHSPHWGDYYSMNWPYIACFVPLHATMFAVAAACTCLLRRAVLGGMAAIVGFALMSVVLEWSPATRARQPIEVYNSLNGMGVTGGAAPLDFTAHGYPLVATAMGQVTMASILAGWLALRRYQPRWDGQAGRVN
jgi:ABC-type transport system involved in multi-copper enzyme maturation permease subunit